MGRPRRRSMGLPLNQMVPNCAPNHLRLRALNKYRCVPRHHHPHRHPRRCQQALRPSMHAFSDDLGQSRNSQTQQQANSQSTQLISKFKLNLAKSRLKLKELVSHETRIKQADSNVMQYLKNSVPIVSNMPLINIQNSSILFINDSPFGLRDKRFGILHHFQPSETYYS